VAPGAQTSRCGGAAQAMWKTWHWRNSGKDSFRRFLRQPRLWAATIVFRRLCCGYDVTRTTTRFAIRDARLFENRDGDPVKAFFQRDDVFCRPAEKPAKAEDSLGFSRPEPGA